MKNRKKNTSPAEEKMKSFGEKKQEPKEEEKEKRKALKEHLPHLMSELVSILSWDSDTDVGIMPDGSFVDFLQITCKDLNRASEAELRYDDLKWEKLYMTYPADLKIAALNFPSDFTRQMAYIKRMAMNTDNRILFKGLELEYDKLQNAGKYSQDREYFLFFYGKDRQEIIERRSKIKGTLNRSAMPTVIEITPAKKKQIIKMMNNLNSRIEGGEADV